MISFIIVGTDPELVKYFWKPFEIKYPDYQYLMTERDDFNLVISTAKNKTIFITNIDAVPTYETMVLLEKIGGKNEILLPTWYEGYRKPNKELNTFSVLKEEFISADYDLEKCVEINNPTIHKKGTMYYVG